MPEFRKALDELREKFDEQLIRIKGSVYDKKDEVQIEVIKRQYQEELKLLKKQYLKELEDELLMPEKKILFVRGSIILIIGISVACATGIAALATLAWKNKDKISRWLDHSASQ